MAPNIRWKSRLTKLGFGFTALGVLITNHNAWPAQVSEAVLINMFQSLIAVSGVLLGFVGIIFGSILVRKEKSTALSRMIVVTMLCLLAFVESISLSFYNMSLIGQGGESGSIELPLDLMLVGTLAFFYGVFDGM